MPKGELEEIQELAELEKSIEEALAAPAPGPGEKAVVLSDEAMAIASLPKIPGESPKQRKQRVKKMREQTAKIGYTFPGVSEDQLDSTDQAEEKEIIEDPMVVISAVTIDGKLTMTFNQDMFYPEDTSMFDYSSLFDIKLTSSATGRITKAE